MEGTRSEVDGSGWEVEGTSTSGRDAARGGGNKYRWRRHGVKWIIMRNGGNMVKSGRVKVRDGGKK